MSKRFWAVSAEVDYGNNTGTRADRAVVDRHPFAWANDYEARYRCTVRLLHWEEITPKEAVALRKVVDA